MNSIFRHTLYIRAIIVTIVALLVVSIFVFMGKTVWAAPERSSRDRLVTVYDRGVERTFVSRAETVEEALKEVDIPLDKWDRVEPARDEPLIAMEYQVNIYRGRPVIIEDGNIRQKIMTAAQTPEQIADAAKIELFDEDRLELLQNEDMLNDGAGLRLVVRRSVPFTLRLYGAQIEARTLGATVGDMLAEKAIELSEGDFLSVDKTQPIVPGMTVSLWRNGVQTVTVTEPVDAPIRQIRDANRNVGYSEVKQEGVPGEKQVTYEISMTNGVETSRTIISEVVTQQPVERVEVLGVKTTSGGLTQSKGVNYYQDSRGTVHRETYYDLNMSVVVGFCNGTYSVRSDGVKVDQDGYVLVAASLSRYPRCSIVETSLGLGKVYDTGTFTSVHPDGFDLATDWTNPNGI